MPIDPKLFHCLQIMHGLSLQITSGLKVSSRGSLMNLGKAKCGSAKQTKKGVLADMIAYTMAEFPYWHPTPNVIEASGYKFTKQAERELTWLATLADGEAFGLGAYSDRVYFELHMLGALLPDLAELAKDEPKHTFRVQAITPDMIRLAANH